MIRSMGYDDTKYGIWWYGVWNMMIRINGVWYMMIRSMEYDDTEYGIWLYGVLDMIIRSIGYDDTEYEIWWYGVWYMMIRSMVYNDMEYWIWWYGVWDMMIRSMRYDDTEYWIWLYGVWTVCIWYVMIRKTVALSIKTILSLACKTLFCFRSSQDNQYKLIRELSLLNWRMDWPVDRSICNCQNNYCHSQIENERFVSYI